MNIDDLLANIKITTIQHSTIDLEHEWCFVQRYITKLKNIREGLPELHIVLSSGQFTSCVLRSPHMIILNSCMTNIVKLLKNISQQRGFASSRMEKLARRLLYDKSANDEHERSILTNLGGIKDGGNGKLSRSVFSDDILLLFLYVIDLTLATENQASFEEYLSNNPIANPRIG
uniref:Uncharacterized protein n=1 Tax=Solanum lycopersicum TaxID=4081 RepID=A0A3Q7EFQ9_SOLLC